MKHVSIINAFLLLSLFSVKAELSSEKCNLRIKFGENIGGTLPMPFPAEIRAITSFSPIFSPYVSFETTYWISKWGVRTGLAIDLKGMNAGADVLYFHTMLPIGDDGGFVEGDYSGYCLMKPKNIYLTIPVMAAYRFNKKWDIGLGGYFSYLAKPGFAGIVKQRGDKERYIRMPDSLGERIDIAAATEFDFAEFMQRGDVGLMVEGNWTFWRDFGAFAHFSFGLIPIFPKDFHGVSDYRMTNTYGCIGLSYKL